MPLSKLLTLREILLLIRPYQWYKNLLIFLALIFSSNITNLPLLSNAIITFFAFCAASSVNYIINDYKDQEKDRLNPEKKNRPLAAQTISPTQAIFIASLLLITSLLLASRISPYLTYAIILFVSLSTLYTFALKDLPIFDILTIGTLFIIRAVAGAFAISVYISPWLIMCPFFLALFLSAAKRYSERSYLSYLKKNNSRATLTFYTPKRNKIIFIFSTLGLFGSYVLYSLLGPHSKLIYTIPFALFILIRYYHLITENSIIARHPQKMYQDYWLLILCLLWLGTIIVVLSM